MPPLPAPLAAFTEESARPLWALGRKCSPDGANALRGGMRLAAGHTPALLLLFVSGRVGDERGLSKKIVPVRLLQWEGLDLGFWVWG